MTADELKESTERRATRLKQCGLFAAFRDRVQALRAEGLTPKAADIAAAAEAMFLPGAEPVPVPGVVPDDLEPLDPLEQEAFDAMPSSGGSSDILWVAAHLEAPNVPTPPSKSAYSMLCWARSVAGAATVFWSRVYPPALKEAGSSWLDGDEQEPVLALLDRIEEVSREAGVEAERKRLEDLEEGARRVFFAELESSGKAAEWRKTYRDRIASDPTLNAAARCDLRQQARLAAETSKPW